MNRTTLLICILVNVSLVACTGGKAGTVSFDNVDYFSEFPVSAILEEGEIFDVGAVGINDIDAEDGLLLVSSMDKEKQINVFDEISKENKGGFFSLGNGPGEVPFYIFFNNFTILTTDRGPIGYLYEDTGKLSVVDIRESANNGFPAILAEKNLENGLRICFPVSDDSYLCHKWNASWSGLTRFILDEHGHRTLPIFGQLDSARISVPSEGFRFNILGTSVSACPALGMAAECSLRLNTIHIYSLSGDKAKTLCYGSRIDDFRRLESLDIAQYPKTFSLMHAYHFGFSCLYSASELMLFNWDGEPAAKLSLGRKVYSYDIDSATGLLFTVSDEDELIRKYDINNILDILR